MKPNKIFQFSILFISVFVILSCSEDDIYNDPQPTEMQANNKWLEDELKSGGELWYKVVCENGSTTTYLEWAEIGAHGEDRNYTGDVMVSAYQLDGITPYIENKDNGYGEKAKSFALANNELEYLVKVTPGETEMPGTFALRSKATSDISVEYMDLTIEDKWTDGTIAQDEILGYKVKYSGEKKLAVIWAEVDTPEDGYTADILVSVLKTDGTTPYKDVDKNKDMLDKNKSHSDDPKFIVTDAGENNFKIHVKNATPGKFAIKVFEVQ